MTDREHTDPDPSSFLGSQPNSTGNLLWDFIIKDKVSQHIASGLRLRRQRTRRVRICVFPVSHCSVCKQAMLVTVGIVEPNVIGNRMWLQIIWAFVQQGLETDIVLVPPINITGVYRLLLLQE